MNRSELAALPVLLRELGLVPAVRLAWRIEAARRAGEPFAELPPPADSRERKSREQAGPAVVMYKLLREDLGQQEALRVTTAVVVESTLVFLRQTIGRLDRQAIDALDDEGRVQFARVRGDKFFNATVEWDHIGSDSVDFTVRRCAFPPLCASAGVPELAPVFCAGDAKFFGTVEKDIQLTRPTTIAAGGEVCSFSLRWSDG